MAATAGCEDGPERIYTPIDTDPPLQSGNAWTQPGERGFDGFTGGDSTGRARFCDEAEATALIERMAVAPIIPDVSVGGIPLWGADGEPLRADDLLGRPEDGLFCDPTETYADAFVWGPTQEVIVLFNQETRLVDAIIAYQSYLGRMSGNVTVNGTETPVVVQPRERVTIGGVELDEYTSRAEAASRPRAWLNPVNVTRIYGMIRETFFNDEPLPADYNCIADQRCDVIYTASDETVPQDTFIDIQDSGIQLRFTPDGYLTFVYAAPVRKADFELFGELDFGDEGTGTVAPVYRSGSVDGCNVDLAANTTWGQFRAACASDARTLSRASYDVYTQRDAVSAGFDGIDFDFLRDTLANGVLEDGERPADADKLYSFTFTRSLAAVVPQFVPSALAQSYATRLAAHLRNATQADESHPFRSYVVEVPATLATQPQRIGELQYVPAGARAPASWVPDVLAQVRADFAALTPEQQAQVNPAAMTDVALIEPFVAGVMSAFSFGRTDAPTAFRVFRTTDDERWSIGFGHFVQGGVTYRMIVQYSLNFGAITAVTVENSGNPIDEVFDAVNTGVRQALGAPPAPYYHVQLANERITPNPFRLGGEGILVTGVDRRLDTLNVTLVLGEAAEDRVDLIVPGVHIDDRSGFLRQLRGQRYEFIRAHEVSLFGKETAQVFHVLEDGTIGRIEQRTFKGAHALCAGPAPLAIRFGTDVRAAVEAWRSVVGDDVYQACELVYNYSEDGHVLNGVASLTNRMEFLTVAGRATTIAIWR